MVNRLLIVKLIYLSILLTGCSGSVADEEEKTEAPPPSYGKAEDGQVLIRHAGDEWSRWKLKEYLTNNELVLDVNMSSKIMGDTCSLLMPDLKNLNFEFIKPDIVTDDWADPRLDPYKAKYEDFKYGLGYFGKHLPDPELSHLPSWNINIYDIDTDRDGVMEAILYGERTTVSGSSKAAYSISRYLVFENYAEWLRGASLGGDPSDSDIKADDYLFSALIIVKNIYAVIVVTDWDVFVRQFKLDITLIGKQDKHTRGKHIDSHNCRYQFNSSN